MNYKKEKKQVRREMRRSEKQKQQALQTQDQLNMEYNDVREVLGLMASDKFRIIFRHEYEKQLIKDNWTKLDELLKINSITLRNFNTTWQLSSAPSKSWWL